MSSRSGSKNRQRQKQVAVRLTDEEHALVAAASERQGVPAASVLRCAFLAAQAAQTPELGVTEHAHQMSGGGYHVWNTEPYILKIYPLALMIEHRQQNGGKVCRRLVIVVEDWTEIRSAPTGAQEEGDHG